MPKTDPKPRPKSDLTRWVEHLRRMAEPAAAESDLRGELHAALARPRWIGGPLLAWRWVRRQGSLLPEVSAEERAESVRLARDDAALWWLLMDPQTGPIGRWVDPEGAGPLFKQDLYQTIEVWTETELSALHALWHHARAGMNELDRRLASAVAWHLECTQPDNATNHPWAVHVFLLHGTPESQHFAETLVSNCMVLNGKPDPLSAWILLDAAEGLDS